MIDRPRATGLLHEAFRVHPVASLLGPRQCGKTTLARAFSDTADEVTYFDLEDDMDLSEVFLKYIFRYIMDHCPEDMQFFNKWIDKGILQRLEQIIEADFERITYTEAVAILEKADAPFEFPVTWGVDLQSEHERYLTEKVFMKPVIVFDYPKKISLRDLAAMFDISISTLSEMLRKGQRKIMEEYFFEET